jgi:asparagine synthase (glutamine-hydrolysing)
MGFTVGLFKQVAKHGLNTKTNTAGIRKFYNLITDTRYGLIIGKTKDSLNYMRAIHLWYGVEGIDPTCNLPLVQFCYNTPEWVYYRGSKYFEVRKIPRLKRRLLVREALEGLVPAEIRMNSYRGEQAADWYLQFNSYVRSWENQLMEIGEAHPIIWKLYSKKYITDLFSANFITPRSKQFVKIGSDLMTTLSTAFFLNYLENQLTSNR